MIMTNIRKFIKIYKKIMIKIDNNNNFMTAGLSPFLGDTHQQVEMMIRTMMSFLILVIFGDFGDAGVAPKIELMT